MADDSNLSPPAFKSFVPPRYTNVNDANNIHTQLRLSPNSQFELMTRISCYEKNKWNSLDDKIKFKGPKRFKSASSTYDESDSDDSQETIANMDIRNGPINIYLVQNDTTIPRQFVRSIPSQLIESFESLERFSARNSDCEEHSFCNLKGLGSWKPLEGLMDF